MAVAAFDVAAVDGDQRFRSMLFTSDQMITWKVRMLAWQYAS